MNKFRVVVVEGVHVGDLNEDIVVVVGEVTIFPAIYVPEEFVEVRQGDPGLAAHGLVSIIILCNSRE